MLTKTKTEALKICLKNKITFTGGGNDRDFWDVAGVKIERRFSAHEESFRCCCKFHSVKPLETHDCSFILALKIYRVMTLKSHTKN